MSQEASTLSKSPDNYTVIQVDKDVSFVLDSRDVKYEATIPDDKNIGLSRRTYCKKYPLSYNPCVSFSDDSISVISSVPARGKKPKPYKNTPQSLNSALPLGKGIGKKKLADSASNESESSILKRGKKRDISGLEVQSTKINGHISDQFKNKSLRVSQRFRENSPDSDIEILDIVEQSTSKPRSSVFRQTIEPENRTIHISSKKCITKPSISNLKRTSYPSNYDMPITVADTAPIMPSYSGISSTNISAVTHDVPTSMKWLSANGTIAFSPMQNGGPCSAKESAMKYADKYNLYIPEMKISENESEPERKPKTKRELKNLYENLNEISWANEKSFQQLLNTSHSERITAKILETEKHQRRSKVQGIKNLNLTSTKRKPGPAKRNSAKLVQRAKFGKIKSKLLVKAVSKQKVPFKKVNKITKPVVKTRKSVTKSNKVLIKKNITKPKTLKVLNKSLIKPNKVNIVKTPIMKREKINKSLNKSTKSVSKLSKEQLKVPTRNKCLDPNDSSKVKLTTSGKEKTLASTSSNKKFDVPSSSLQNHAGNCSQTAKKSSLFSALEKNMLNPENFTNFKDSSFIKELKNFEVANELELLKSCLSGEEKVTALKKGSKLRVTVEPLQHTKLWNADFYEAFKKHVLEQAFLQTFEKRDNESISTMFQELQEACFNPPNNVKPLKKKKPEEECLRSSVRQSEGAFRYKEIVVKKHENYMQFVLVPNSCKRNSLTIEAMKELREAFLLAKKDPNCRAVLLNSSGTYFCTGIDLSLLVGSNKKQVAEEMASTIRDLVLTLSTFTKPVIAAVNGTAVGFGVSLLTYCDVVLASDKATFCIPATRLGYLPEGAITLTLPQVVGSGVATEMLLYGRRLTAEQALRHGLVSEVLWPTQLMNEVVPRIQTIVSQPLQVMEATKTMVRCHLWDKLKTHIEREWRLLPPLWLDAQCQHNIKRTLQTGWLVD